MLLSLVLGVLCVMRLWSCPLAFLSPGPSRTSRWLTGVWAALYEEKGSSQTGGIVPFLSKTCPSSSCVWHTASSPSPLTPSSSASRWASSASFSPWAQTPCGGGSRDGRERPPALLLNQMLGGPRNVSSFPHVVLRRWDKLRTHTHARTAAITQIETCQGQGRQSDKAHRRTDSVNSFTIVCHLEEKKKRLATFSLLIPASMNIYHVRVHRLLTDQVVTV